MGRVKTSDIKKSASGMLSANKDKFKPSFEENKDVLRELNFHQSKRVRNKIAGYIARTVKRESK